MVARLVQTNLFSNENSSYTVTNRLGAFSVVEYDRDWSVYSASGAMTEYFASKMNFRKKQVVYNLNGQNSVILQAGAMQIMTGNVNVTTDIKGAGDLVKKMFGGKVTGESAIKPKYTGTGAVILEPTYKHIILEDIAAWGGAIVVNDGMFLACDGTVDAKVQAPQSVSSAILGGEGLFNIRLQGNGIVCLESNVPRQELVEFVLDNDQIKIDGNMAVAWSPTLSFTVERTTKTLIGSAASGEGFVNVYRGTGRILVATVAGHVMRTSTPSITSNIHN